MACCTLDATYSPRVSSSMAHYGGAADVGLNECRKIADSFDEGKHIIMFNPRLMR